MRLYLKARHLSSNVLSKLATLVALNEALLDLLLDTRCTISNLSVLLVTFTIHDHLKILFSRLRMASVLVGWRLLSLYIGRIVVSHRSDGLYNVTSEG